MTQTFKQIAIELYQPRTGGLSIGGKFAPKKMKVQPNKELPGEVRSKVPRCGLRLGGWCWQSSMCRFCPLSSFPFCLQMKIQLVHCPS